MSKGRPHAADNTISGLLGVTLHPPTVRAGRGNGQLKPGHIKSDL